MKQKEHISTTKVDRKKMRDFLGIERTVLDRALRFERDSFAARKARVYAVNFLNCEVYIDRRRLIS